MGIIKIARDFYFLYFSERFRYKVSVCRDFIRRFLFENKLILKQEKGNKLLELKLKGRKKIRVVFFAQLPSIWKYDLLYRLMEEDSFFEPFIFVTPELCRGDDYMNQNMEETYKLMLSKGYSRVFKSYDEVTDSWKDVRKLINPDMIFFTRPFHRVAKKEYSITAFPDILTCYAPYSFYDDDKKLYYDELTHNLLWKFFMESEFHKKLYEKHSYIKGRNAVVSGYPGCDPFLEKRGIKNEWKLKDNQLKRIIWAPHHSIEEGGYTNFLSSYQEMYNLALKYKDRIQFVLKPHPGLRYKLYVHKDWGKERTDNYFEKWNRLENAFVSEGDYVNLFLTSDALMHDSGSFMVEYLYTLKPLFYVSKLPVNPNLGPFSKKAYNLHYKRDDMTCEKFIENIVLEGKDPMYNKRKTFFENYLINKNNLTASENILLEIKKYL